MTFFRGGERKPVFCEGVIDSLRGVGSEYQLGDAILLNEAVNGVSIFYIAPQLCVVPDYQVNGTKDFSHVLSVVWVKPNQWRYAP